MTEKSEQERKLRIRVLVGEDGDRELIDRYLEDFEEALVMQDSSYLLTPTYVSNVKEFAREIHKPEVFCVFLIHEEFPEIEKVVRASGVYIDHFDLDKEKSLIVYNDDKLRKALAPTNGDTKYMM